MSQYIIIILILCLASASVLCLYYSRGRKSIGERLLEKQRALIEANGLLEVSNSRALESVRMKNIFINHISREMREPSLRIRELTQLIHDSGIMTDINKRRRILSEMQKTVDHITSTMNRLLELSDIESIDLLDRKDTVRCNALCRQSIKRSMIKSASGGSFRFHTLLDDSVKMNTNEHYAMMVILYLLDSVRKAAPAGNVSMTCNTSANGRHFIVSVKETLSGINEYKGEDLLNSYDSESEHNDLRGRDLYLSRKIARKLGGDVVMSVTPDKRSELIFSLPVEK